MAAQEGAKRVADYLISKYQCHRAELLDNWDLIAAKEDHYEISPEL